MNNESGFIHPDAIDIGSPEEMRSEIKTDLDQTREKLNDPSLRDEVRHELEEHAAMLEKQLSMLEPGLPNKEA